MTSLTSDDRISYAASKNAVVFAFPDVAILRARGSDRIDLLNRLSTNELKQLKPNQGSRTVLTNEKGRIIDVLTVLSDVDDALLLCSPGNQSNVTQWLKKYTIMDDFKVIDGSADYCAVEIHGPESTSLLTSLAGELVLDLPMSHWQKVEIFGHKALLIRQPAFCEFSFLLLFESPYIQDILREVSALSGSVPIASKDVVEVLRIEAGSGKYGAELTDSYNPLEAGLLHLVNFKKGCYIGQEVIARIDSYNKVKQRVMGFVSNEELNAGSEIWVENTLVGTLTSAIVSPDYGNIALGYIRGEFAHPHSIVQIHRDNLRRTAEIMPLPFE